MEFGPLKDECRDEGHSLFAAMLHALVGAANAVPQLRQRVRVVDGRDQVVEHEVVHAGATVDGGGGLFTYATIPYVRDRGHFCEAVGAASRAALRDPTLQPNDGDRDDLLYASCLPWVRFTQVVHPVPVGRLDTTPRVSWGKLGGDGTCPVNIQAHHALVDGVHLGRFFEALQSS